MNKINIKRKKIKNSEIKMEINIMIKNNLIKEKIKMIKIVNNKNKNIQVINLIITGKDNHNKIIINAQRQNLLKIRKFQNIQKKCLVKKI